MGNYGMGYTAADRDMDKRSDLQAKFAELKGIDYHDAGKLLHEATHDCHGAGRLSWEITWLTHQIAKHEGTKS